MQIPEHKLQEVLERTDLLALVSRHVPLKKVGRAWVGLCPFHQEKSPSFNVNPERGFFKCFGCQVGGDAISFVQKLMGKSFLEAVMDLAKDAGVDLQAAADPAAKERAELREVTELALGHFRARLADPRGQQARDYLLSRGVTQEIWERFGCGWAPPSWDDLSTVLMKAGMLEWGHRAGVVGQRTKGDGYYDVFRGRVMIPIRAADGRAIAFGGRLLVGDDGPKYLNSKESRLYSKSDTLYGLDQAKDEIRKRKSAVLVEGYFDCIGCHLAGVRNAVALCSTALTPGHLASLGRHEAKELVLLLDGDDAGRKAVERLAGPILAHGTAARVASLPQGEDPDTFARKAGPDGMQKLLEAARPLTEHLFVTLLPEGTASSFEAKMQALDRLKPVCAALPVGLTRSAFFGSMAHHFGLPAMELEASLRGRQAAVRPAPKPQGPAGAAPASPPHLAAPRERSPSVQEATYVALALADRRLVARDPYQLHAELSHVGLRGLLEAASAGDRPEDALAEVGDLTRRAVEASARTVPEGAAEREAFFLELCRMMKREKVDAQLKEMARITGLNPTATELDEATRNLLKRRSELVALRQELEKKKRVNAL